MTGSSDHKLGNYSVLFKTPCLNFSPQCSPMGIKILWMKLFFLTYHCELWQANYNILIFIPPSTTHWSIEQIIITCFKLKRNDLNGLANPSTNLVVCLHHKSSCTEQAVSQAMRTGKQTNERLQRFFSREIFLILLKYTSAEERARTCPFEKIQMFFVHFCLIGWSNGWPKLQPFTGLF